MVSRTTRLTERCRSAAGAANKHWEREKRLLHRPEHWEREKRLLHARKKRGLTVGARKVSVPTRGGGARTHPPPLVPAVRSRHLPHSSGKKKAVRPRGNTQEQLILTQEKRQRWNRP
ncbi:hypothetical protein NDU88_006222 [Pleurodeles waltl]|uniref:Uncharacterized protein n=1 Tax=Pleurodeles waltl TaxID=8319 RepID=A0AAV7SNW0_PLEWA|nr:hypothetical protein NDU88_006222 [Pleurodeles waltl]